MTIFASAKAWILPVAKTITMGLVAYGVIGRNELTPTERALIVAIVSGLLGIIAVAVGQWMAGRNADKVLDAAVENQRLLERIELLTKDQTIKLDEIKEQTNGEENPA